MKKKFFVAFFAIITLCSSCYYDVEQELYPVLTNTCDTTTTVSYATFIAPLMQNNCNICHAQNVASGDVITDNYDAVKAIALDGTLYGTISHNDNYSAMPKDLDKLNLCDIQKVKLWIEDGALNN